MIGVRSRECVADEGPRPWRRTRNLLRDQLVEGAADRPLRDTEGPASENSLGITSPASIRLARLPVIAARTTCRAHRL